MNATKTLNDSIKKLNEATTSLGKSRGVDLQQLSTLTKEPTAGQAYGSYNGSEYDTALNSAIRGSRPTAPVDENKIRNDVLAQFQGEIDATNKIYAQKLAEAKQSGLGALGTTRATQARSGLLGSDFGAAQTSNVEGQNRGIQNSILNENAVAISAILGQARKEAAQEIADKRAAQQKGLDTYLGYLSTKAERTNARLGNLALSFVQRGVDPTTLGEAEMAQLQKDYGVSKDDILGAYASATTPVSKTPTASIQEYEYAKQNGYTGSYTDYQNEDANRKAKATGGAGGLSTYQQFQAGITLGNKVDKLNAAAKEVLNRSALANQAYNRYVNGETKDLNATTQVIITNFNKLLDPTSVVRESEYARSPEGQAFIANIEGKAQQLVQGGAGLTAETLKEFVNLGNEFAKNAQKSIEAEKKRAVDYGNKFGIDTTYVGGGYVPTSPPTEDPQVTELRQVGYTDQQIQALLGQ